MTGTSVLRNQGEEIDRFAPVQMGVSYAYGLATTLYNDVEQRPEMVKQGLQTVGIERVRRPLTKACASAPNG